MDNLHCAWINRQMLKPESDNGFDAHGLCANRASFIIDGTSYCPEHAVLSTYPWDHPERLAAEKTLREQVFGKKD
mgnify:CR=1 FL=1|tara:strand:+ start:75 stop:299 length:225 start_codon:yes stop_codon:yes gene_type:complete